MTNEESDKELNRIVQEELSKGLPGWPLAKPPPGGWPEVEPPELNGDEWK